MPDGKMWTGRYVFVIAVSYLVRLLTPRESTARNKDYHDPMHHPLNRWLSMAFVALFSTASGVVFPLLAQPADRAVMLGVGAGISLYHGEFNSFQQPFSPVPGFSLAGTLQYNISSFLAVGGTLASTSLCYNVEPFVRSKYASNFFGPAESSTYPGSSIAITDQNAISVMSLHLFVKLYIDEILPDDWTFFAFGGIGMIDFTPKNTDGSELPQNITGPYDGTALIIPFGGGAEYEISPRLRAFGEYTYHSGFTDYMDGYAHYIDFETSSIPSGPGTIPTQSDHHSTLRFGVLYQVYRSEKREEQDVPTNTPAPVDPLPSSNPLGEEDPDPVQPAPENIERDTPAHERLEESTSAMHPESPAVEDIDTDGDLLSDKEEVEVLGTDPLRKDSDGDGLDDGEEVRLYATNPLAADTDGDLLSDLSEVRYHGTSPRMSDTDHDRLTDNEELSRTGTDPLTPDSDGDGVLDGEDACPLEPGSRLNGGCPGPEETRSESGAPLNPPSLEPGARREFSNIFFLANSDEFDFDRPETEENLKALRDYLNRCDKVGVLIEGHTSSEGNPEWNQRLSAMRAEKVRSWLIDAGVAPSKILGTVGYGSRLPKLLEPDSSLISPAALERIRAQNRRITSLVREECR